MLRYTGLKNVSIQVWTLRVTGDARSRRRSARAGVPAGGVAMIRSDGHIGFWFPPGHAGALAALDRHLSSYLIPDPAVGPPEEAPCA